MTISSQTTFEELQLLSLLYPGVSWELPIFINDVTDSKRIKRLYACLDNPYKNISEAFDWQSTPQKFTYWMHQSRLKKLDKSAEVQIKIWIWILENDS